MQIGDEKCDGDERNKERQKRRKKERKEIERKKERKKKERINLKKRYRKVLNA